MDWRLHSWFATVAPSFSSFSSCRLATFRFSLPASPAVQLGLTFGKCSWTCLSHSDESVLCSACSSSLHAPTCSSNPCIPSCTFRVLPRSALLCRLCKSCQAPACGVWLGLLQATKLASPAVLFPRTSLLCQLPDRLVAQFFKCMLQPCLVLLDGVQGSNHIHLVHGGCVCLACGPKHSVGVSWGALAGVCVCWESHFQGTHLSFAKCGSLPCHPLGHLLP